MKNLVQITQDGACILDINDPDIHGFFTQEIETCVIYIFRTKSHWIAVHDSGQLRIRHLLGILSSYGKIQSIYVIYGRKKIEAYKKRHDKLLKELKYNKRTNVVSLDKSKFDLFVTFENFNILYALESKEHNKLHFIPEIEKVNSIVKLNNAFIKLGSGSLPVDVQYSNKSFLGKTKLLHSLDHILERIKEEPRFYTINIKIVQEAIESGVINLNREQKEVIGLS